MKSVLSFFLLVLLAACGGGEKQTVDSQESQPQPRLPVVSNLHKMRRDTVNNFYYSLHVGSMNLNRRVGTQVTMKQMGKDGETMAEIYALMADSAEWLTTPEGSVRLFGVKERWMQGGEVVREQERDGTDTTLGWRWEDLGMGGMP